MNPWIDVNAWTGQFPFRSLAGTTVEETEERLSRLGFGGMIAAPMEAIFQEDSYAAEENLSCELEARQGLLPCVWQFKVVNPVCAWWEREWWRAVEELCVSGLRLCPTFHGYRLDDPVVARVMGAAAEANLPVQVLCKMQDWRLQWLLRTADVEVDQVEPFARRFGGQAVILSGLHVGDMLKIAGTVNACPRLVLDTSRLKGPWRTFDKLLASVDSGRLAFGSLWPINLPECPLAQIEAAAMPTEIREAILGGNAAMLLAGAPAGTRP